MRTASRIFAELDLKHAGDVIDALERGAAACAECQCRRAGAGSTERVRVDAHERISASATLVATGDLHDNPLHLMRLCRAAGMEPDDADAREVDHDAVRHLTLHELIHGERLMNGLDYSYRVLARAAALKAEHPERVHVLLANHELAQATGQQVAKDGVRCNQAFDAAIETTFGDDAEPVTDAVRRFIFALPLAAVFEAAGEGDGEPRRVLCAHSLPAPETMTRPADPFDPAVLERPLEPRDYASRTGSAHMMVWGRGQTPEQIETLARRWGVDLFILGHEKAESGALLLCDRALVLNSDHEQGVWAMVDLADRALTGADLAAAARPLSAT